MIRSMQAKIVWSVALSAVAILGLSAVCMAYRPSIPVSLVVILVGATALAGVTALSSRYTLAQPLTALQTAYEQLRPANESMQEVDDIHMLVAGYDRICTNLLRQHAAARAESEQVADALHVLLAEVSEVARGNLSVEVLTTIPATESIAAAFNTMVEQLRNIVGHVQEAVLQLSSAAHEIQANADHLADGSTAQSTQIVESSAALDEMVVSIQDVSEHATLSAAVAEQALSNAKQGARAVQNTIEGMHRIRIQVQETAARIKSLGERSQEINEIVQVIGDIADRTSVLALNASIEAALAGEAGQGFAIVAQEVERLAQRATTATRQITHLVTAIQSETTAAVTAMEQSTHEVVFGSHLADEAGQALSEIEGVSARLAELMQSISQASRQQARGSESLSKAMGDIAEVTQQMAAGTIQAAASINNLALLADELRMSVSMFQLARTRHGHRIGA